MQLICTRREWTRKEHRMELKRKSTYWGGEKEVNPEFAVLGEIDSINS